MATASERPSGRASLGRASLAPFPCKHRVFILTDITNEPDDAQSFCRYLTYSNQFKTEGVVAVTSVWLRDNVAPESLHGIVHAYEKIVHNLNAHAPAGFPYPTAAGLRDVIKRGAPVYGMAAVGDDVPLSDGGRLLLERLESADPEPLWVLSWGGVNVLAQVLHRIRNRADAAALRSKLRVYTISDQDDCGSWIRQQWPDIFYICSVHGWNQYGNATWGGISGDVDRGGPDPSKVTHEWVAEKIQRHGPLGAEYPDFEYIIEGDTPTFLYLIQNGLGVPEEPSFGSWGGRYLPVNVSDRGVPRRGHFCDSADSVVGINGGKFTTNKATIWRWRNAFQDDFAARMIWTVSPDFASANHSPVISVNGSLGYSPVNIEADAGSTVTVDASATYDPDGDHLSFKWFQYVEPSSNQSYQGWEVSALAIREVEGSGGSKAEVGVAPADESCIVARGKMPLERGPVLHLILEVTDSGTPPLTSYRRIMIQPVDRSYSGSQ